MITPFENRGQYRKGKSDLTQMAETVDEDVQSNKVGCNPFEIQMFRKRNGSGETLHLDKRTQNVVKLEGGWGRAHKEHAVE